MPDMQMVVFELEKQQYGLGIDCVNGINKIKDFKIHKIPNCPPFIEGIINLRGKVIPLYNLRRRFFDEGFFRQDSEVLIVFMNNIMVGLIVDEVLDIIKLEDEDIEPAENLFFNLDSRFIRSIGKTDENMIIILDTANILTITEQQQITPIVGG